MKERRSIKTLSVILLAVAVLWSIYTPAEAHTQQEISFYDIFENNGTVMLLIDGKTGDILHANETAGGFYGYSVNQLESMNMSQINDVPQEEMVKRMAAAEKEQRSDFVLNQKTADGGLRTVEAYVCPHEQDGDVVLFATIYDITDKVRLQKRHEFVRRVLFVSLMSGAVFLGLFLFLLSKHYRSLKQYGRKIEYFNGLVKAFLDAYGQMVSLKDGNLRYIFVNKALKDFCRKKEDEIIGYEDFDVFVGKEFAVQQRQTDLDMLKNNTLSVNEISYADKVYKSTKFPVKLESGSYGVGCYTEDITEKKQRSEKIEYLSFHDPLTGLYNRMYYEHKIKEMDIPRNLPLSVIMADVNGLKLTNDIFGHESGDLLLQKAAEVFQKVCREEDVIARIAGDEFVILMPNTKMHIAEAIVGQIKSLFSLEKIQAIKGSISMGADTKSDERDDINHVIGNAEIKMYSQKTLERKEAKESTIKSIVEMLCNISPEEERHAQSVSRISEEIGRALNLPEVDVRKLKEAGLLHDIGKITLEKRLLDKYADLSEEEIRKVRQHPVIGYRILNSFDETLDIAGLVLAHHECWDGSGYPKGLKGNEIPLLARIIAAAEYYDTLMHRASASEEIKEELKAQSGIKLDPQLVSILI